MEKQRKRPRHERKEEEYDDVIPSKVLLELPSPKNFYKLAISKRIPMVLKGLAVEMISDGIGDQNKKSSFSRSNFEAVAGNSIVEVEVRPPNSSVGFGRGNLQRMQLKEFLKHLNDTDQGSRHYLATQTLNVNEEGRPNTVSSPVKELMSAGLISNTGPNLMGKLVLMNVNTWIGRCDDSKGNSSRFHHDYHDNLYILLQGRKKFRLASPAYVGQLPTGGKVDTVFANGRISYKGFEVREDGAPPEAAESLKLTLRLREINRLMESTTDPKKMEDLENELDQVLAKQLDMERGSADVEEDDYGVEDGGESSQNAFTNALTNKKLILNSDGNSDGESEEEDGDGCNDDSDEPVLNFCNFDSFEAEKRGVPVKEVELETGDALYLPAGWYHEVFSSSSTAATPSTNKSKNHLRCCGIHGFHENVHMAINYWYFPPNTGSSYERPYNDTFWEEAVSRDNNEIFY